MRGWTDLSTIEPIETERLRLCVPAERHFEPFAAMMADEESARFIGGARGRTDSWRTFAMILGHWTLRGYGLYAVEDRASGTFMGRIGLLYPDGWPALELGYALARPFWRKGHAREACIAVMEREVRRLSPERLVSIIADDNELSQKLARSLGAVPAESMTFNGTPVTLHEYDLSR
ncbi:MAG: GNAT family N-acetyltransferase [Geminicoccaceae bacterium]